MWRTYDSLQLFLDPDPNDLLLEELARHLLWTTTHPPIVGHRLHNQVKNANKWRTGNKVETIVIFGFSVKLKGFLWTGNEDISYIVQKLFIFLTFYILLLLQPLCFLIG